MKTASLADTPRCYGLVSVAFHWVNALLLSVIIVGVAGWRLIGPGYPLSDILDPLHRPVGVLILILAVFRSAWAVLQRDRRPRQSGPSARWVRRGHLTLYALLLITPVTAMIHQWGHGKSLDVLGLPILRKGPEIPWAMAVGELHEPLAFTFIALIMGHIGMALFHHFVKRDETLSYITPWRR